MPNQSRQQHLPAGAGREFARPVALARPPAPLNGVTAARPGDASRERLIRLPRLTSANAAAAAIPCKICGSRAAFFDVVDFNKCPAYYPFGPSGVTVSYYRCDSCGLLFTPFCDDWSHEDFRRLIYNDDYVLLDPEYVSDRPMHMAASMARHLRGFETIRILDYGAGQGLFARQMAELGFPHVASYDPFSLPTRPRGKFDMVTCFEVIEHIPSPMAAIADMLSFLSDQGCIVLGEVLQPADIDRVRGNWWYVAPRNGHVSTFADRTLAALADRHGMVFYRGGEHVLLRGSRFIELAERFGKPLACFRLGAPGERRAGEWHGVETDGVRRFQWTEADALSWDVVCPPGPPRLVQVMVPYVHEARADFAAECTLQIDGRPMQTMLRESCIFAESTAPARGAITVTLRTPGPATNTGGRSIGLAIRVPD